MNYEDMTVAELKAYAKTIGITVGNIGKEKLIAKIKDIEAAKQTVQSVIEDTDLDEDDGIKEIDDSQPVIMEGIADTIKSNSTESLLESISSAIDDLDDSSDEKIEETVDLPMNEQIPVKSIVYGILVYKSRTTNSVFRWSSIGSLQYMSVAEINEMHNYNSDFLRKPLVILMDERAVRKFRLTSVYENVAKINNLTEIFKSDLKTIEKVIDDVIHVGMRDVLVSKVRQMYKSRKLKDIDIIRLLEKKLQFDLSDSE